MIEHHLHDSDRSWFEPVQLHTQVPLCTGLAASFGALRDILARYQPGDPVVVLDSIDQPEKLGDRRDNADPSP